MLILSSRFIIINVAFISLTFFLFVVVVVDDDDDDRIADIIECTQGVQYDAARGGVAPKDDSCYLTIAIQASENRVRYVSLMLESRDERNSLVTGIRYDQQLLMIVISLN